ncbi:hypothetical protein BOX15_Mlig022033g1 [Macrostomum lignano]|uniref:Uncharacterized protein n=1 Tax=Macrostomum lignano TaxID=282301 RepID=A0A267GW54_9PLAT|nr:hypothetical protein BOX15_Mlig022033g1 [Macrostomum lignano]
MLHPPADRVKFSAVLSLQALIVLEAALLSVRLLFFEGAVLEYLTTALRVAVLLLYVQMRLLEYYCATRHAVPYPSRVVYFAPGLLLLLVLCCTAIGQRATDRVRCFSFYQVAFLVVEWLALLALSMVSYKHLKRLNRINTEPSVRNYLRCTVVLSVLVFAFGSLINLAYWLFLRSSSAASCSGVFNHDLRVYLPVHSIVVVTAHLLPSLAVLILFYQDAIEYKKIHEMERQRLLGQCERLSASAAADQGSISPTRSLYRPVYAGIDPQLAEGVSPAADPLFPVADQAGFYQATACSFLDPIQELEETATVSTGSRPNSGAYLVNNA